MTPKNKAKNGFTLVELLISIALISLLSSIIMASANSVRQKSRDEKRKKDLKQIETALEFHYDKYGSYTQPETLCSDCSTGDGGCSGGCPDSGTWHPNSNLQILVSDGFLPQLPTDPVNNATYSYTYEPWNAGQGGYSLGGQAYDLCATLEAGGTFCINKR